MKLSVQLYSLREEAKTDFPGVLSSLSKMGYDGVEMAGLHGHAPTEVRQLLDRLHLEAPSAHGPVFDRARWAEVQETAAVLGHRHLIGNSSAKDFADESAVRALAERVNAAIDHFAPLGYTIGYHNHWWEFETAMRGDLLFSLCPRVAPQFDVYWVKVGGADPVAYLHRYAGRSKLVHLKDGPLDRELPMTALGTGKMDIRAIVGAALETGIEWGVVELDRCGTDMLQAVDESLRFLRPLVPRQA
jgi:sugar phosphate isomerase/epimerase